MHLTKSECGWFVNVVATTGAKEITLVRHEALPPAYHVTVCSESIQPQAYDRAKLNRAIFELVAFFLGPPHELSNLLIPSVEHQLKLCWAKILVVLLHIFKLLKGAVAEEKILEHPIVLFDGAFHIAPSVPPRRLHCLSRSRARKRDKKGCKSFLLQCKFECIVPPPQIATTDTH